MTTTRITLPVPTDDDRWHPRVVDDLIGQTPRFGAVGSTDHATITGAWVSHDGRTLNLTLDVPDDLAGTFDGAEHVHLAGEAARAVTDHPLIVSVAADRVCPPSLWEPTAAPRRKVLRFYADDAGERRWRLHASNGRIIAGPQEGYAKPTTAEQNALSVLGGKALVRTGVAGGGHGIIEGRPDIRVEWLW